MIHIQEKKLEAFLQELKSIREFLDRYFEPEISEWIGYFEAKLEGAKEKEGEGTYENQC